MFITELFANYVLLRFLCIGALNTLFGYTVYSSLIYLNLPYVWACLMATLASTLFNFKTLSVIVFRQADNKLLLRFLLVYAGLTLLNMLNIKCGRYFLQNLYLLGGLSNLVTASTAFFLHRYYVFRR